MKQNCPSPKALILLCLMGCDGGPGSKPEGSKQDVVLIVVDTLRSDRLGLYGGPAGNSPALDRLSKRAVVFENAITTAPWTLPSTASILTGSHPYTHGADLSEEGFRNLGESPPGRLKSDTATLAELLYLNGYTTKGFAANPYLSLGLERGFEEFTVENTEGAEISQWARRELLAERDAPLFLYLHYMDTHMPNLVPHSDVRAIADQRGEDDVPSVMFRAITPRAPEPGVREAALLYYDAAVHYVDRCIETVLNAIDEAEARDSTLVCIVSDHGEEFYDHQALQAQSGSSDPRGTPGLGHGHTLFKELLWPTWVIAGGDIAPNRVRELVSLMDVTPTLLQLAGIPAGVNTMDGTSVVDLLHGRTSPDRTFLVGSIAYGHEREALITPEWKLVVDFALDKPLHLFDRQLDPMEQEDVLAQHPEVVEGLLEELGKKRKQLPRTDVESSPLPAKLRGDMKAVGY